MFSNATTTWISPVPFYINDIVVRKNQMSILFIVSKIMFGDGCQSNAYHIQHGGHIQYGHHLDHTCNVFFYELMVRYPHIVQIVCGVDVTGQSSANNRYCHSLPDLLLSPKSSFVLSTRPSVSSPPLTINLHQSYPDDYCSMFNVRIP